MKGQYWIHDEDTHMAEQAPLFADGTSVADQVPTGYFIECHRRAAHGPTPSAYFLAGVNTDFPSYLRDDQWQQATYPDFAAALAAIAIHQASRRED